MRILEDIYCNGYFPNEAVSDETRALREEEFAFLDKIEKAMGAEVIEQHWERLAEIRQVRDFTSFREGFRFGALLMLDLLEPRRADAGHASSVRATASAPVRCPTPTL